MASLLSLPLISTVFGKRIAPSRGHIHRGIPGACDRRKLSMSEESPKIIYTMRGVTKRRGGKAIIEDINLSYFYGAKIGVVGLNGAGKSTVMRILAREDTDHEGETHLAAGHTIGHLHQEPQLDETKTVQSVVEEGVAETRSLLQEFEDLCNRLGESLDEDTMTEVLDRQGVVQQQLDDMDAWSLDSHMEQALDALRCPPGDTPISVLSGGEKRRVALCRLLLQQPDILLLDEPTNHLDVETLAWLENHLHAYPGTVIAVTHDRYFLDNVAGWILELENGKGEPWRGNYRSWLEQKQKQLAARDSQPQRREALRRELAWIRYHAGEATNEDHDWLPQPGAHAAKGKKGAEIFIPEGPRLGQQVIEAEEAAKHYRDRKLFDGLTFAVPSGAKVGIIGPNGAGKTTLFRMITGAETPDSGTLKVGQTVKLAHVEQSREGLAEEKPVWEAIADGQDPIPLGAHKVNARAYAARFGFTGDNQQQPVKDLSGGERNRVHLARMLKSGANVILLDEPTNDLDVNTMRALEDAILNFEGCVLAISHDRWFLDRIATHILAFEDDEQPRWFAGNHAGYEADRQKRMDVAPGERKTKHRKLTRS